MNYTNYIDDPVIKELYDALNKHKELIESRIEKDTPIQFIADLFNQYYDKAVPSPFEACRPWLDESN